ncbi:MAG TPA: hypothetical protein VFN67_34780 [Polyangiales bacterium]|nr:hypothetical protein [Polyangiales bacterium]
MLRLSRIVCLCVLAACSDEASDASGTLSVLLEPEDVISHGLEAGDGADNIRDGWSVSFDKYLLALGHIDVHLGSDEAVTAEDASVFVVDLTQLPTAGLELWKVRDLRTGRWEFFFEQASAKSGAKRHDSSTESDFQHMVDNDYTYFLHGKLSHPQGRSCPPVEIAEPGDKEPNGQKSANNPCYDAREIRFELGAEAQTVFGPCETDGVPGFSVAADSQQTVSVTIHGDHLFFNGFPEGGEGGVTRLGQWLADCDLNLDGTVTRAELEQITPAQLPELDQRFQLGGSPIAPLKNMYDYVRSQLKTQGHINGEGECPIDGVAHAHADHEH